MTTPMGHETPVPWSGQYPFGFCRLKMLLVITIGGGLAANVATVAIVAVAIALARW
jgi:hypothetical protein